MDKEYQEEMNEYLFLKVQERLLSEHYIFVAGEIKDSGKKILLPYTLVHQFFDYEQDYGLGLTDYGQIKISIQHLNDNSFDLFKPDNIEVLVHQKGVEDNDFFTLSCYNSRRKDDFLYEAIISFINEKKSLAEKMTILSNINDVIQNQNTEIKKRI